MGGAEINVAYDGTFGDLSAAGDAELFGYSSGSYDFELMGDNGFTAINSSDSNVGGTISPKDLHNDSVPPSTSFTNLTTPGSTLLDTPDDYQTSPLFTEDMGASNGWFSLFPEDNNDVAMPPKMERTTSNHIIIHPGGDGNARKRSSTTTSPTPFSSIVKHSQVAGVGARKRDKPLPPIVVDEGDTVALKRARNTAAARKSRAKKVQERDDLEGQIADLQAQVEYWKNRALSGTADE
ncbi:Cross-pathway control protein A [Fulvia fulva]|uniref:Cross-pathway control protein A n=1 Tax=Passalora fulva TaxID=5499 RepID=A0A9Q8P2W6_PASFU|nr:Cross-pathway control protein A [Fulvia fulva]UJO11131.1 Cross-pathway control protein A [Fulvia fulva]WPV09800.1 Cross-pathway control protein A [Fulvia fulva]